jgi:hypothetical protein
MSKMVLESPLKAKPLPRVVVSLFMRLAWSEDKSLAWPVDNTTPEVSGVHCRGTPEVDTEQMLPPDPAWARFALLNVPNILESPVAE